MSSRVVFYRVDGGILKLIQLEKTSPAYMAINALFEAELKSQSENPSPTIRSHVAVPSNLSACRREQPPHELDDGSSTDASLDVSHTTATESDSDEEDQPRRTPKQRKRQRNGRFVCVECGHVFHAGPDLRRHLRTHTGEKPYKCMVCGKAFADSSALAMHKRTHTGKRPYRCAPCGKAYTQSNSLRKHERRHHAVVAPFKRTQRTTAKGRLMSED